MNADVTNVSDTSDCRAGTYKDYPWRVCIGSALPTPLWHIDLAPDCWSLSRVYYQVRLETVK